MSGTEKGSGETHPGFEIPHSSSSVEIETMSLRLLVARRWCDHRRVVLSWIGAASARRGHG